MRAIPVLVVVGLVASAILFAQSPRLASACQPARQHQANVSLFDGWLQAPGQTVFETRSTLTEYNPYVYSNSVSTAWVMLSDNRQIGGVHHYAQVGWEKWRKSNQSDGTRYVIAQWTVNNDSSYQSVWFPDNYGVGTWIKYEMKYYNDGTSFNSYANDGLFWQIQSDFVPNQATVSGEITDAGTQMPGGILSHVALLDGFYQTGPGVNHFFDYPLPASPYISAGWEQQFANSVVNITQIDIWDQRCND